jgi:hypothetical protein
MTRVFLPTLEEIRHVCAQIRAEWSPDERAKREGERYQAVRIQVVKTREVPTDLNIYLLDDT